MGRDVWRGEGVTKNRWSVVMAYYNEEEFLAETLRSLGNQSIGAFDLILVDNASSDRSREIAEAVMRDFPQVTAKFLTQPVPGQMHALQMGVAAVETEFTAIADADTFYPAQYLATCERAFARGGRDVVAVMATDLYAAPDSFGSRVKRLKTWCVSRLLSGQCHTGSYAFAIRTAVLVGVGSFDVALWPYMLFDHELVNRLLRRGRTVYPLDHWCMPSDRRPPSADVRWSLGERILYHLTPYAAKDWFFYTILAGRFAAKRMGHSNGRKRPWEKAAEA